MKRKKSSIRVSNYTKEELKKISDLGIIQLALLELVRDENLVKELKRRGKK